MKIHRLNKLKVIVPLIGFFTFFFGFAFGALINLYLIFIESPLITTFRAALSFKSTIFGDGVILPIISMIAAYFLQIHRKFLNKFMIISSIIFGIIVTSTFHIIQATLGLVNWSMPTPWHWNSLGIFHAMYMLTVTAFLSLFYTLALKVFLKDIKISWEVVIVSLGLTFFLILLFFDYHL